MWQNNNGRIDETFTIKKKNPSDEEFVEVSEFEKDCYDRGMKIFLAYKSVDKPKIGLYSVLPSVLIAIKYSFLFALTSGL